ncbi:MAG: hypothetical protein IT456_01055 [Planctomycetes bacterium]|nr:hypothetical protein [Planctomycetota bacterium]
MKPIHILFWLAVCSPLLALIPSSQDPAQDPSNYDWAKEVDRASSSPRYAIRLAAAKRIALGGGAPVPALRAFVAKRGKNELPAGIVETIAEQTSLDAPLLTLLQEWATDLDFYWRAQALRGLANRAPLLPIGQQQPLRELFAERHTDPAWLVRVFARLGSARLGNGNVLGEVEEDPRATSKLTALLLRSGQLPPLQPLLDALADERTFLDSPWGQSRAREASLALKDWLAADYPIHDGEAAPDKAAAIAAIVAAAAKKSGQTLQVPALVETSEQAFTGGFEILSCRTGDLFVRWNVTGEVQFGLDGRTKVQLPGPVWEGLSKERATLPLSRDLGVVICDNLRLRWGPPDVHIKVAPNAMPETVANWFLHLAKAIAEADQPRLTEALRTGLEQFGPR